MWSGRYSPSLISQRRQLMQEAIPGKTIALGINAKMTLTSDWCLGVNFTYEDIQEMWIPRNQDEAASIPKLIYDLLTRCLKKDPGVCTPFTYEATLREKVLMPYECTTEFPNSLKRVHKRLCHYEPAVPPFVDFDFSCKLIENKAIPLEYLDSPDTEEE